MKTEYSKTGSATNPLRIGIVGAGFAGKFHVECLRRVYGARVELAGVTSLRKESREAFGKKHDIPAFDSVASMLREVDVLDICSPACAHEEQLLAAAESG